MKQTAVKTVTRTIERACDTAAIMHMPQPRTQIAANDTLFHELEMRYGSGFAQWVVDRM
jgi:hypothetical protein